MNSDISIIYLTLYCEKINILPEIGLWWSGCWRRYLCIYPGEIRVDGSIKTWPSKDMLNAIKLMMMLVLMWQSSILADWLCLSGHLVENTNLKLISNGKYTLNFLVYCCCCHINNGKANENIHEGVAWHWERP